MFQVLQSKLLKEHKFSRRMHSVHYIGFALNNQQLLSSFTTNSNVSVMRSSLTRGSPYKNSKEQTKQRWREEQNTDLLFRTFFTRLIAFLSLQKVKNG